MARRPKTYRLWLAIVVVAAGIGLAGGLATGLGDAGDPRPAGHQSGAVSISPTAVDVAVVPARTEAASTTDAARHGPGRGLLPLVAAVVGLGALVGIAVHGRARSSVLGPRALRARRHAIALRAPPALLPV